MKLNVILITYKQEEYIRKTLESILMQETSFDYTIIVADDASPDDTLAIIKEYSETSSVKFQFLDNKENLGFVRNYQRAFAACDAQYIAIMEGDDYWTSPKHLQNHVDFLDSHPENSMSFNRHIRFFQSPNGNREEIFEWEDKENYKNIRTEDMIYINRIGNLSCCVFRNELIKKLPEEVFGLVFADWLLGMVMGQFGDLAYQKEVTSAYRIHDDGQWSKMSDREQDKSILETLDEYDKILKYKYTKEFQQLKKWKTINVYGDKSLKGRIKSIMPDWSRKLFRKICN